MLNDGRKHWSELRSPEARGIRPATLFRAAPNSTQPMLQRYSRRHSARKADSTCSDFKVKLQTPARIT